MEVKPLSPAQIELLNKPLPPEAVKPHPTKTYLSTIKAIYVIERFNQVFGLGGWYINNEVVEHTEDNIVVKSTFHAPMYGIIVPDIFGGNDNIDRGDAYKGACTDALTKIGSYLGVGMDVFKGLSEPAGGTRKSPSKVITKEEPSKEESRKEITGKKSFSQVVNDIGAEIDRITGLPFYQKILKKEGFASPEDVKTQQSKEDVYTQLNGFLALVKSMLNPEAVEYAPGQYRTPKLFSELDETKRHALLNKLDQIAGI